MSTQPAPVSWRSSSTTRMPALAELGYLLGRDDRVGEVLTASSGTEALQVLDARDVDVVFSDISHAGPRRHGAGPGHLPLRRPAAGRLRHRARPARGRRLRRRRHRLRDEAGPPASGSARRCAGSSASAAAGGRGGRGDPRPRAPRRPRTRPSPSSSAGVTRFITAHDDPLRPGARGLRPPAHRRAARTSSGSRSAIARGALGRARVRPHPPQHPRLAPPRQRGADGARAVHRRRRPHRAAGERRHTKELRDTLLRRPIGDRRPAPGAGPAWRRRLTRAAAAPPRRGCGSRAPGAVRREGPVAAPSPASSTSRPSSATSTSTG